MALALALACGASAAAPDEAAHGRDDGYPTGDRDNFMQQRHMVGACSAVGG